MRIGVMCHASFGGSARIGTELAIALAERGHRVHIFTGTPHLGSWDQVPNVVVHIITPNGADGIHPATLHTDWSDGDLHRLTSRILRVIATEGLDVLHFHDAVPFAFVAQRLRGVLGESTPLLVGTLHGSDVTHFGEDPVRGPHLAEALRSSDLLTTVSTSHARLATTVFGLSSPPDVIPNFVDLSRFRPHTGAYVHRGPGSRMRIAHVSNFRPVKDPQSMARIFLDIRARMEAELWLIGSGEEMAAVRSLFEGSAFADDVVYLGLQRDVAPLLRDVDLLLMTSLSESFCLVALEAMACGVPVLATRVGGLPEVVVHRSTGMLFPLGDHKTATEMAVSLLSNPMRHRAMGEASIRHARRFGVERIVPAYEELYQRHAYAGSPDYVSSVGR
jgi:N-acetyl-alpha-D-glucosaminyl L-malate synthase BshA